MPQIANLTKSLEYKARAAKVIPGYCSCYSRAPMSYVQGVAPVYVENGEGCRLNDVDGNQYLDFTMGLCPSVLGYAHPLVTESVRRHVAEGILFSLPHRVEVELAEKLVELVPCAEMVRFGKNGADATTAAVRLARAYTGRDMVAMCGYHGWQDWYIATTDQDAGIPDAVKRLSVKFLYNSLESLAQIFQANHGRIACVIMEPMSVVWPEPGFLQGVKELARENGALLVFDEVVTGFRWSLGGAQERFGVIPDLACLSKGLANGLAISALVGRADVMEYLSLGKAFWSTTYGNEALSMAVALDVLDYYQKNPVIEHLWRQGQRLRDGFQALVVKHGLQERLTCQGAPPRHVFLFPDDEEFLLKSLFQQECIRRGLLTLWCHNVSWAHQDKDVDEALGIYDAVMGELTSALQSGQVKERLLGPPVRPVFRRI